MSSWHGWDLEDMRLAGHLPEQTENFIRNEQLTLPAMASFTPINAVSAPSQFISPQKTLHERDIYDIFDDPEEEESSIPIPAPKKRGRAKSNGQTLMDWEHASEDAWAGRDNDDNFEVASPKRMKSVPAKRTKLPSASAMGTLPLTWPESGWHPTTGLEEVGQNTSHLTTPPDSSKPKKQRAASAKPRVPKPKMGPFKAPTITKPAVSRQKETGKAAAEEVVQPKPISYLGFVTSQQTVMLAQTTLDKLAAFRYIPPATMSSSGPITEVRRIIQLPIEQQSSMYADNTEPFFNGEPERVLTEEDAYHERHIDHDATYEGYSQPDNKNTAVVLHDEHADPSECFFTEAAWNGQTSSQPRYTGQTEEEHSISPRFIPVPVLGMIDLEPQVPKKPQEESVTIFQRVRPILGPYPSMSELAQIPAQTPAALSSSQYESISSSDFRVLLSAPDPGIPSDHPSDPPYLLDHEIGTAQVDMNVSMLSDASYVELPGHRRKSPSSQVLPILDTVQQLPLGPSNYFQVPRSDPDEVDVEKGNVSHDSDMDDFDQGLDDSDFVELMSEQRVPTTQYDRLEDVDHREDGTRPCQQRAEDEHHNPSGDKISAQEVSVPDSDDEFAMDDDIEEEMMHLDLEVIETFQPPTSVPLTSGGGSTRGEVYDKSLQFSSPNRAVSSNQQTNPHSADHSPSSVPELCIDEAEDWSFISSRNRSSPITPHVISSRASSPGAEDPSTVIPTTTPLVLGSSVGSQGSENQMTNEKAYAILDDSHEYEPMNPFARPDFPTLIRDRSPVVGLSPQSFLRVCFRIGEMLFEGARRNALGDNAIIELFARVTHSSREPGTTRQHFQFADLWHDRPPFPSGVLANYKSPDLLQTESKVFIAAGEAKMARCFGKMKRDARSSTGWLLDIISIRTTDWEEIRWTKRIVSAGLIKSEK